MSRLILFFSLLLVSCSDGRGKDVKKYDISERVFTDFQVNPTQESYAGGYRNGDIKEEEIEGLISRLGISKSFSRLLFPSTSSHCPIDWSGLLKESSDRSMHWYGLAETTCSSFEKNTDSEGGVFLEKQESVFVDIQMQCASAIIDPDKDDLTFGLVTSLNIFCFVKEASFDQI